MLVVWINKIDLAKQVLGINIGFEETNRIIKVGKGCTYQKRKLKALVREYKDACVWSYDDLNTYDTKLINHTIPLNKDERPFK